MTWFRSRRSKQQLFPASVHRSKFAEESDFSKEIKKELEKEKDKTNEQRRPDNSNDSR